MCAAPCWSVRRRLCWGVYCYSCIRISRALCILFVWPFCEKKRFSFFFPFDVKSQVLWRCIDLNFITAVEPACILNVIQKILCWKCWYYMIPFIESGFISSLMTLFYSLRIWQVICNNQTHVYILMCLRLCIGVKGVDCSNSTVLRSCLNNNNNKWQWCDKGDISVWCLQLSDHCTHFLLIRYLVLYSQKSHICDFSSESKLHMWTAVWNPTKCLHNQNLKLAVTFCSKCIKVASEMKTDFLEELAGD